IKEGVPLTGFFNDGTTFRVVGRHAVSSALGGAGRSMPGVVLFTGSAVLPDGLTFPDGIYASENIDTGRQAVIRSLYGESNAQLRERSVVSRWIHVGNQLHVESRCVLYGRASADG